MKKPENIQYVIFLSLIAAFGGFLFGYDTAIISGTVTKVSSQFHLTAIERGWYVGSALIGSILGVSVAGALSDKIGRKPTMYLSAVLFLFSGTWCALSTDFNALVMGRIVGGTAIGMLSIVCIIYLSEISIAAYRGRMVSFYQLAVTVGFFAAYLMNYSLIKNTFNFSNSSIFLQKVFQTEIWRAMLWTESIPALIFLMLIFGIPESPRWLILHSKDKEAEKTLKKIYAVSKDIEFQISETKQMKKNEKKSDFKIIFEPWIFKAVLIGSAIAILGQFMGINAVLYYGPSIFESNGLSTGDSLYFQLLVGTVNVITTLMAIFLIDKIGRKKLVYVGVTGIFFSLILIGFYFFKQHDLALSNNLLLFSFLLYIFFCAGSINMVIFVFLSEMYPAKVRGLAMSIAELSLWFGTYLIGQLTPWLLSSLSPAGTFWIFALMCLPYLFIVWRFMPETTGKSLEDIERFWIKAKTK